MTYAPPKRQRLPWRKHLFPAEAERIAWLTDNPGFPNTIAKFQRADELSRIRARASQRAHRAIVAKQRKDAPA